MCCKDEDLIESSKVMGHSGKWKMEYSNSIAFFENLIIAQLKSQ